MVPYFLWALLSLICSCYVAKIALQQVKKASQVHPLIILPQAPSLEPIVSASSIGIDLERGNEENSNDSVQVYTGDQRIKDELEEQTSITNAIQIFSMNGNEQKDIENGLPMIAMMECPTPFIGPSVNLPRSGYLSPSISICSPKQGLSPCRFRKFKSKDPFLVVAQSTNNGVCAASDNTDLGVSLDGKLEKREELTPKERFTEIEVLKKKDSVGMKLNMETIVGKDVKDKETNNDNDNIDIIQPSPSVKAISFICRQLRNISQHIWYSIYIITT